MKGQTSDRLPSVQIYFIFVYTEPSYIISTGLYVVWHCISRWNMDKEQNKPNYKCLFDLACPLASLLYVAKHLAFLSSCRHYVLFMESIVYGWNIFAFHSNLVPYVLKGSRALLIYPELSTVEVTASLLPCGLGDYWAMSFIDVHTSRTWWLDFCKVLCSVVSTCQDVRL